MMESTDIVVFCVRMGVPNFFFFFFFFWFLLFHCACSHFMN